MPRSPSSGHARLASARARGRLSAAPARRDGPCLAPPAARITGDGRHLILGDLIDLADRTNLTEQAKARDWLARLTQIPEADMVVYPAGGEERATITVFTDSTCPFCRKLHREIPFLQAGGGDGSLPGLSA